MDIKRIYSGRFKSILFVGIISLFVFAIVKNKVYFNSNQNFVVSIIATGDKNNNSNGFFGVSCLMTILIKYASLILRTVFTKQKYVIESIEKLK